MLLSSARASPGATTWPPLADNNPSSFSTRELQNIIDIW